MTVFVIEEIQMMSSVTFDALQFNTQRQYFKVNRYLFGEGSSINPHLKRILLYAQRICSLSTLYAKNLLFVGAPFIIE